MSWYTPPTVTPASVQARQVPITPTPSQHKYIVSDATICAIVGSMGEGKCTTGDTLVLLADGALKRADAIRRGDGVMGDDGTPRQVLSTCHGEAEMYRVTPYRGEPFTVTGDHILVLKRTRRLNTRRGKPFVDRLAGSLVEITVRDFLAQSRSFRLLHHLYRVPVEFPFQPVRLDPYFLGLWLGDGNNNSQAVTTADPEIVQYLEKVAQAYELDLVQWSPSSQPHNRSRRYAIRSSVPHQNALLWALRAENLLQNKHIPYSYKCNSRDVRLQVLAGLIDTDGWPNHGGYQIIQKNQVLADDIAYVARSLGYFAIVKPRQKQIKSREFTGTYYHIMISGDCTDIPVRVPRKMVLPRRQKKDIRVSAIRRIDPVGVQPYYGFTTDGNHRFLLGDFTVTHNSWSSIMAVLYHAYRCQVPIRCAIVRDTYENIKGSVVPAFQEFFQEAQMEGQYKWHDQFRHLDITTQPAIRVDLFGIDDLAALTRLQGPEYALIWLEEPCPYTDAYKANAGLSEDVFNAALVRCARQKGTKARLQLSSNYPDEEHWFFKRILSAPDGMVDPETPLITKEVIHIPYRENVYLKEESRQATIAAYRHDPVAYTRFVKGESATKYSGRPVTGRVFNPSWHVAPMPLAPVEGLHGFLGWDSWGNPAAVLGQQWPDGRLWILDECVDGEDVRDLLHNSVNPLVLSPRWRDKCFGWRQMGDRTMKQPDQSNMSESAADAVEQEFDPGMGQVIPFEPGPQTWPHMRLGIMHALQWSVRGQPAILIDPARCKRLIAALKGRWHYPTNRSGAITQTMPLKDSASHVADSWANAVCVLMPWSAIMQTQYMTKRHHPQRRQAKQLANSYNTRLNLVG